VAADAAAGVAVAVEADAVEAVVDLEGVAADAAAVVVDLVAGHRAAVEALGDEAEVVVVLAVVAVVAGGVATNDGSQPTHQPKSRRSLSRASSYEWGNCSFSR
jgi:hypothetical protein